MKPTLRQRFRYRFDNLMSRGTPAMIGTLFVLSALIVLLAGVLIASFGITQEDGLHLSFWEALWGSLMRTLDAGTMGGDTGAGFRFVMLLVTLGGIFIVSALIGVLSSAIEGKMDRLRKGRSQVLESNHTLVLGWSVQIFTILNELMIANENQSRARIVILADEDKVEMEDRIQERVKFRGGTRIVCRSGNPLDPNDLEIVSPHTAKSIICQRTILTLTSSRWCGTNNPQRQSSPTISSIRKAENLYSPPYRSVITCRFPRSSRPSGGHLAPSGMVVPIELMDFEVMSLFQV